jgi:hypothetical protein
MPSIRRTLAILLIAGCASHDKPPPVDDCATTGKCDLPDDPSEVSCSMRRADAYNENRTSFNEGFLRWSCADVSGVTLDDRGQEYCEYFAIAQLPADGTKPAPAPIVLGRNLGEDSSYGTSPAGVDLTAAQITALEANETAVVGQCVFTTWNSDQPGPVAACDGPMGCPKVMGVAVDETNFRMVFSVNSTDAAQKLVEDCATLPTPGDEENPHDLRHDDFMRGCLWDAEINQTEFRKSDTTICSSMTRVAECGCTVTGKTPLSELVSPWDVRGFQLGGWQDFVAGSETETRLPANCRYIDTGENGQTLVSCDLTASDLITGAADVRSYCQDKYADVIVVHVPIPTGVTCDPTTSESPYAGSCSATPWVLAPPAAGY